MRGRPRRGAVRAVRYEEDPTRMMHRPQHHVSQRDRAQQYHNARLTSEGRERLYKDIFG